MNHPLARPAAALTGLAAATVLLHLAGSAVPSPPLEVTRLPGWWVDSEPLDAFVGSARILALAAAYWLMAVTALGLMARTLSAHPLEHLATRLAPAAWRTLVLRPLAATVVVAPQVVVPVATMTTVAAAPEPVAAVEEADAPDDGAVVIEMRHARTGDTTDDSPVRDAPSPDGEDEPGPGPAAHPPANDPEQVPVVTMRAGRGSETPVAEPVRPEPENAPPAGEGQADRVEPESTENVGATTAGPILVMETPRPASEPAVVTGPTHVVAPGEHLWSIAAAHLAESTGTAPSTAEIAPYWRELVEANRAGLPDPANPDLLLPGVELRLPPVG